MHVIGSDRGHRIVAKVWIGSYAYNQIVAKARDRIGSKAHISILRLINRFDPDPGSILMDRLCFIVLVQFTILTIFNLSISMG